MWIAFQWNGNWDNYLTYQCKLEPLPSFLFPSCHEGKELQSFTLLPARPGFWWKLILITEQMKKLSFHLHKRHTCLIHRHPQGGSHKPISQSYLMQNIAQWMKNRSMQIFHYEIHCTLILNRYLNAECDVSVSRLPGLETFANFLVVSVSVSENLVSEKKSRYRYRKIWSRKKSYKEKVGKSS